MASFSYQARAFNGDIVKGSLEAANESEARIKLRAKKMIPIKIVVGGSASGASKSAVFKSRVAKVKSKDLQIFTRQLSVLISSGVPLIQSLEVLGESPRGRALDAALQSIVQDISEGKKLGAAFQAHPHVFNKFYINMLIAGEEGGVLDQVLSRLAIYIEKSVKLQGKIKGTMSYPIIVLFISLCVVTGLLVFVIPQFVTIFQSSGMEIPGVTQMLMDASDFVIQRWYLLIAGFAGTIFALKTYLDTPAGRLNFDRLVVRIPVFGDFVIKSAMAKFSRTLSTLLGAGVSIMDALGISASTCGNTILENALLKSKESVAKGQLLSIPLAQEQFIPHMVTQMIAVGEQTGNLDEMLNKVADFYEDEVDVAVTSITSIMEPAMIVVLGGIVGFFVIGMYLPIFSMAGGV